MSAEALTDITKIVVETDEEDPKTIAVITADDIDSAEGFRVRITPKYDYCSASRAGSGSS
ncbi:hypothetical protein [Granulicatella adiacens]|uniref:hypothetical protein n=1 Tax=Granulicatella adiacens TaxID=46124 RepID=UPI001C3C2687|nr:hypothetical protein [Granulicatella adiacens]